MRDSIVVGCDAVDADPDWLRLRDPAGPIKTIPWSAIRLAALLTNDEHTTFGGDLEQITTLRATHDPLWIGYADGLAIALLEKDSPKREPILAVFRERLESRWMGEGFSGPDAVRRFTRAPGVPGGGIPKVAIMAVAGMLLLFLLAFVVSRVAH